MNYLKTIYWFPILRTTSVWTTTHSNELHNNLLILLNAVWDTAIIWHTSTWNKQKILNSIYFIYNIFIVIHSNIVWFLCSNLTLVLYFSFQIIFICNLGENVIECKVVKLSLFFILMHLLTVYISKSVPFHLKTPILVKLDHFQGLTLDSKG